MGSKEHFTHFRRRAFNLAYDEAAWLKYTHGNPHGPARAQRGAQAQKRKAETALNKEAKGAKTGALGVRIIGTLTLTLTLALALGLTLALTFTFTLALRIVNARGTALRIVGALARARGALRLWPVERFACTGYGCSAHLQLVTPLTFSLIQPTREDVLTSGSTIGDCRHAETTVGVAGPA